VKGKYSLSEYETSVRGRGKHQMRRLGNESTWDPCWFREGEEITVAKSAWSVFSRATATLSLIQKINSNARGSSSRTGFLNIIRAAENFNEI
jgi:hypothetical protein